MKNEKQITRIFFSGRRSSSVRTGKNGAVPRASNSKLCGKTNSRRFGESTRKIEVRRKKKIFNEKNKILSFLDRRKNKKIPSIRKDKNVFVLLFLFVSMRRKEKSGYFGIFIFSECFQIKTISFCMARRTFS